MQTEDSLLIKIAISTLDCLSLKEKIILQNSIDNFSDLAIKSIIEEKIGRNLNSRKPNLSENLRLSKAAASIKKLGISYTFYGEADFPKMLCEIADPPYALYYRGDLGVLAGGCVSVVGTRRITPQGKAAAHDFSYDAASDGVTVVSGLAMGVDGAAHRGAVDAFFDGKSDVARTAAVLAGGIDNVYPACHKKLAADIIQNGGCVLSECPPGVPCEKWRFVRRNRICAGLSAATLVVEAPPGSGALITADFALDYNRELVFHKAAFGEMAKTVSKMVHANLAGKAGSVAKRKIEARCERYVNDGAPVIENYKDFCEVISSAPGSSTVSEERALF